MNITPNHNHPWDTVFCCEQCGREERTRLANCMQYGWPHCHGQPMHITSSTADVSSELDNACEPLIQLAVEALRAIFRRNAVDSDKGS